MYEDDFDAVAEAGELLDRKLTERERRAINDWNAMTTEQLLAKLVKLTDAMVRKPENVSPYHLSVFFSTTVSALSKLAGLRYSEAGYLEKDGQRVLESAKKVDPRDLQ